MFYIVGLGNPGEDYANTRHNVGFSVLKHVIEKHALPEPVSSSQYAGDVSEGTLHGSEVRILFPNTYMNKSGSAVRKAVPKGEDASRLIVIYDDVDLPIGAFKLSFGRGSGGHNGVQSIIDALGTRDFIRVRVGIASKRFFGGVKRPKGEKLSRHVLSAFKRGEVKQLEHVHEEIDAAIACILKEGIQVAMNRFN